MDPIWQRHSSVPTAGNPLVPVVRLLTPKGKQAMYAATNSEVLRRRTWDGCAFNQAGTMVGEKVSNRRRAAKAFDTSPHVVARFIAVWDELPGSDATCTALLRDAILEVGLFTEPSSGAGRGVSRSTPAVAAATAPVEASTGAAG